MNENQRFSITAYYIHVKERQKFYGEINKDNAEDMKRYISNKISLVNDVLKYVRNNNYDEKSNYIEISNFDNKPIVDKNLILLSMDMEYGKNGQEFKTIEANGAVNKYNEETKLIKYYKIFFVHKINGPSFMVVFRSGINSCKTAITNEFSNYVAKSNVIVNFIYMSNNEYISDLIENSKVISLNYTTMYSEMPQDNADDYKIVQKKYSLTSVDLSLGLNKGLVNIILAILKNPTHAERKLITSALDINPKDNFLIDENSYSVLLNMDGFKRTVSLHDAAMFYDVDITSKLKFENSKPTQESIEQVVVDYTDGIIIPNDLKNE